MDDRGSLSGAIVLFIVGAMALAMPSLIDATTVSILVDTGHHVSNPTNLTDLTNNMVQSMSGVINLMSMMFYISVISFLMKGVLRLKQYNDEVNGYVGEEILEKQIIVESLVSVTNDIKPELFVKNEFYFNLDFENEDLNNKLKDIERTINSICSLPSLEKDTENKILISSTQEKYVKEVHQAYISIPSELRNREIKNTTATSLAMEQLIMISNGLLEIENELLNDQFQDLNIMNRFLKEKFPEKTEKKYLTLNA